MEVNVTGKLVVSVISWSMNRNLYAPMEEPWPRIIRDKTYSHIIPLRSHSYGVSPNWVDKVRCAITRNPHNSEIVLSRTLERRMQPKAKGLETHSMKVHGMLESWTC